MKQLANHFAARVSMAVAIASVVLSAFPAFAQDSRLSLADRVTQLEQQTQKRDQGGVGMVNTVQQLQAQVQQLQGQIEEAQHHLQQLDDKNKAQYLDLDSRLSRLEKGGAPAPGAAATPSAPANAATASPPNPGQSSPVATSSTSSPGGADAGSAPEDQATVQSSYDVAFKALQAGDYAQASRDFQGFIKQYPNQTLTPNAWYWLGESYYVTTNYKVALETFQHLLSQFPQSEKIPDGTLKVGYCQYELKQIDKAKATLSLVTKKYPGTRASSLAKERLQQIQVQSAN